MARARSDGDDRFRRIVDRVRDVIFLGLGSSFLVHEVFIREGGPNLVAGGIGLALLGVPSALALFGLSTPPSGKGDR